MWCSLKVQFFFFFVKLPIVLTFVRKIIKNNNLFFSCFFSPLFLFNQEVSLMQETRNQTGNLFCTGFPRREEFTFLSPQKDARLRTSRNQFEGSISEEHAFRSSGLGHRKLSGLSSLSGGIRRRLSRYMWNFTIVFWNLGFWNEFV